MPKLLLSFRHDFLMCEQKSVRWRGAYLYRQGQYVYVCVGGRGMRGAGEGKHKEVGVMRVTLKMEWAGQAWL